MYPTCGPLKSPPKPAFFRFFKVARPPSFFCCSVLFKKRRKEEDPEKDQQ
jgi:hypothetical protein